METKEEEVPSKPALVPENSTTQALVNEQTLVSTSNISTAQPSPILPVVPPTLTPQRPVLQPVVPSLTTPPLVLPPIAPIPTLASIPRPLATLPVRPPIVRPSPEENGSDSDSDHEESGSKRAASVPEDEISEESKQARERQEKAMQDLLMKCRAFALAVPTNNSAVRARLRRLGDPITLFREREMERRDRLRMIMVKLDAEGQLDKLLKAHEDEESAASAAAEQGDSEGPQTYPFYTEGPNAILEARIHIAKYSCKGFLEAQLCKEEKG